MRNNPLPLIIPCHRVIKSNGMLGGFSGKEGVALKKKMIDLESKVK
jgi:O-6-methylguanine DNA methyltransferase